MFYEEVRGDTSAKDQHEGGGNTTENIAKMLSLTDPLQVREEYRDNHGRFDTLAKKDNEGWYHEVKPLSVEFQ